MGGFAWVTLATNDSYSLGALVLANSLKQVGTRHQLAVLVTPGITSAMREKLASVFNVVQEVNILDSRDETNLRLLKRPELGITFTKLHCWRLTQFEKCVFLDADTLVLQNSDELFDREELSAAPDVGWPDCFNSGVFVYRPSLDTYERLIQFALERGSFDGGDQGLLNLFFSDWAHQDINKHLPFIYNVCSTACYSYLPAFKQFGANAKIIHFIGSVKPWLQYFNTETKKVHPSGDATHVTEFLQRWWDIFCAFIHPQLSPAMQGQSQHRSYPVNSPPQYEPPVPNPGDFENSWDPWDEYDLKVAQNPPFPTSFNTAPDPAPFDISQEPEPTFVPQESSYTPQPEIVHRVLTPPPHDVHIEPELPQIIEYRQIEDDSLKDCGETSLSQNNSDASYVDLRLDINDYEFSNNDQTPQSPNDSDQTPVLPIECQTSTTVSNGIPLTNTTEDIITPEKAGLAGAFSQLTLGVARTAEQDALENVLRKQAWEVGSIDYLGKDSFENIWSKISQTLSSASAPQESQAPEAVPVEAPSPAPTSAPIPAAVPSPAPTAEPTAAATPSPSPAAAPILETTPAAAPAPAAAPSPAPATAPAAAPATAPIPVPAPAPTPAPAPATEPAPALAPAAAPTPAPPAASSPAPTPAKTSSPAAAKASGKAKPGSAPPSGK